MDARTRPARSSDLNWLAEAVHAWSCTLRWDLRGRTPPPAVLDDLLWLGTSRHRVAEVAGVPAGLLQLTAVDLGHGVAQLDLLVAPDHAAPLRPALAAFGRDAFDAFPLRKLYVTAAEDALDVARFAGKAAPVVARLPAHVRRPEGFVDLVFAEIQPEAIEAIEAIGEVEP